MEVAEIPELPEDHARERMITELASREGHLTAAAKAVIAIRIVEITMEEIDLNSAIERVVMKDQPTSHAKMVETEASEVVITITINNQIDHLTSRETSKEETTIREAEASTIVIKVESPGEASEAETTSEEASIEMVEVVADTMEVTDLVSLEEA